MYIKYLLVVATIFLSGCISEFEDISTSPEFNGIIGFKYETRNNLLIFGYTLKAEKDKALNGYVIHDFPGISGPEILSKSILPKGSIFTIKKIESCTNCLPFTTTLNFVLDIQSTDKYEGYRVHIGKHVYSVISGASDNEST